ncbi:Hypothetical protein NGAL_HAMBI1145_32740 [Neorhizobium galegae bv. officinalis]|uniref:Uncharacterized protein n=1 Tax=Neorhizobium galegae bv. officinalis TaxID=323656 RepID=A0A0T7FMR1_NEOGA|nr:Hypothetical protein NGAL_HAMBI1145_32740 [Neorhizobium galegae bv. officinalis]
MSSIERKRMRRSIFYPEGSHFFALATLSIGEIKTLTTSET